jgi:hypothetical protein
MLVKRIGEATALEVRATGISYVFAPCIAVMDNTELLVGCFSLDFVQTCLLIIPLNSFM